MRLKDKTAIVTGGASGFGAGIVRKFALEGARVLVADINADGAKAEAARHEGALHCAVDVSDGASVQAMVETAIENMGHVDILVNNAGILRDRMSWKMAEAEWDAVLAVHLKGHFTATRAAIAYWREQAKGGEQIAGRIINTTSEAGLYGNAGQANYGAAKAGILGLQNVLVEETRQMNLTINAVSPRAASRMAGAGLTEDMASASQVSPLVVYLASDSAADINGQVFLNYGGTLKLLKSWEEAAEVNQPGGFTAEDIEAAVGKLFENNESVKPPFIPKL